jgi:hypothetical protein
MSKSYPKYSLISSKGGTLKLGMSFVNLKILKESRKFLKKLGMEKEICLNCL